MNDFGTINRLAVRWVDFMGGRSYEIAMVFLIAACLWLLMGRKASAFLGYGLFMLVLIKAVLPFNIPSPALLNEFPISAQRFSAPMRDWGMRPVFPLLPHELAYPGETMETARIENAGELPSAPLTNKSETIGQRNENQILFSALFMLVWTAVVCFLLLRFIRSQWITHRFILRAKQGPPVDFPFDFDALKKRIDLRRDIQVASSDSVSTPFVWGVFRPHLIVPHDFSSNFSEKQMRWIVLHELAHIKRHDALMSSLQKLAQIVYFFHPAVWITNGTINRYKEYICDDIAMAASQTPRMDCGQSILSLTKQVNRHFVVEAGLLGGCRSSSLIRRRLMRILDEERVLRVKHSLGIACILILAACITLPSVRAGNGLTAPRGVDAINPREKTSSIDEVSTGQVAPIEEFVVKTGETTTPVEGDTPSGKTATRSQMTLRLVKERKIGRYFPNYNYFDKSLSPDGLKVVSGNELDPNTIVVKDLASGVERKYEQTPMGGFPPVWSPDGKRIAFRDAKAAEWSDRRISILTLESGDVEKTEFSRGIPCGWSGDGRFLLVVDHFWDEEREGVQLINLETREKHTVVHPFKLLLYHELPRLSPDGKYVVYHIQEDGIFVQPIGSSEPIRIISDKEGGSWNWYPLWTADGKHILFTASSDGNNSDLYSVAFQDGKPVGEPATLVSGLAAVEPSSTLLHSCSYSGRLLYGYFRTQRDIFSTNIDPVSGSVLGESAQLTDGESQVTVPVWSRNGRYIAYWRETTESEDPLLRVMSSDGSGKRTLGSVNRIDNVVAWHPDNEHILYPGREADPDDPGETLAGIYSISIRSRERKLVHHDPDFRGDMDLSPDGKHLALTSGSDQKPQLYIVDYDGQNRRQLVESDGLVAGPYFTPDGREIIYTFLVDAEGKDYRRSIMAVSSAGGEPREIYASEDPNDFFDTYPSSWLPDGRFVFDIIRRTPGDRSQYAINMNGKSDPVRISDSLGGFQGVSPDGTKAVFGGSYHNFKLWLMSDFLPDD